MSCQRRKPALAGFSQAVATVALSQPLLTGATCHVFIVFVMLELFRGLNCIVRGAFYSEKVESVALPRPLLASASTSRMADFPPLSCYWRSLVQTTFPSSARLVGVPASFILDGQNAWLHLFSQSKAQGSDSLWWCAVGLICHPSPPLLLLAS